MFNCKLVGFFESILLEGKVFHILHWKMKKSMRTHNSLSFSPDMETLSWLSVTCPSLVLVCVSRAVNVLCSALHSINCRKPFLRATHRHHSEKIINYHSVMVNVLLVCFNYHKWQFYINHLFDILRKDWLYFLATLCAALAESAEQKHGAG